MASPVPHSNVACWYRPWSLAAPGRFRSSRLRRDSCISLAWAAVCNLARGSSNGSFGRHTSLELMVATLSPFNCVPSRSCCMRSRDLPVTLVAGRMASWSRVHSFRSNCLGSSNDLGNSNSQKANGFPAREVGVRTMVVANKRFHSEPRL